MESWKLNIIKMQQKSTKKPNRSENDITFFVCFPQIYNLCRSAFFSSRPVPKFMITIIQTKLKVPKFLLFWEGLNYKTIDNLYLLAIKRALVVLTCQDRFSFPHLLFSSLQSLSFLQNCPSSLEMLLPISYTKPWPRFDQSKRPRFLRPISMFCEFCKPEIKSKHLTFDEEFKYSGLSPIRTSIIRIFL